MATNTPNYGLVKPGQDEFYTIDDFNTNVDIIDEQLSDKTDKSEVDGIQSEIEQDKGKIDLHIGTAVNSEEGVHNIRYHEEKLEFNDGTEWVEIYTGGKGLYPGDVIDKGLATGNAKITIKWGDPSDAVVDGQTACKWAGTKLVYKAGSYPLNPNDGIMILDSKVRDQYKTNGFTIEGLINDTTYYFALFPYSDKGAVNLNATNRLTGTARVYRVYTVKIDESNSNPATCCTYADDAVVMIPGSDAWDTFFGHYPCLFQNRSEVGKLNRNNFTQFENEAAADTTSGNAGDVMICFPRRGLKISKSGSVVTISMTDNPNDPEFDYYAHARGATQKDKFYLGAYKGSVLDNKLRSLSNKRCAEGTIGFFRTKAQANGVGYEQSAFYQLIFRQAMYVLKYKNLDSQSAVGVGYTSINGLGELPVIDTGLTDTLGMDYGEATGKHPIKLFGLEDFWGNTPEKIDGLIIKNNRDILTNNNSFNDFGNGYTVMGALPGSNPTPPSGASWATSVFGTSQLGFLSAGGYGSETTHYCDQTVTWTNYGTNCSFFGGARNQGRACGAFNLYVYDQPTYSSYGARLMYL